MKTKHTLGKWIVVDSGGKVISQTTEETYSDICTLADRPLAISPEVEANAKLIAAAPELLEALSDLIEKVSPYIYKLGVKKGFSELVSLEQAKKAIKKATE